jgi:O-antigen/teichoic acid export membrane protein
LYNIGYKYFSVVPMLMLIIMMPLWSAFTDAWIRKEITWIKTTIKNLNYLWIAFTFMVMIMLLLSNFVYKLWVGSELKVPNAISIALAINITINIGAYIYSIFLNGTGIIKIQFLLAVFGIIVNIPLAVILGKLFGVPGVILASSFINLMNLVFFIIQYKKIINLKATGLWSK